MRNIFKTFKENKMLLNENARLKFQNEVLINQNENLIQFKEEINETLRMFKENTDNRICKRDVVNIAELRGSFAFNDINEIHCPIEQCKWYIAQDILKEIISYIEFDIVDNHEFNTKNLIGTLSVIKK